MKKKVFRFGVMVNGQTYTFDKMFYYVGCYVDVIGKDVFYNNKHIGHLEVF
ncbi:hypothetical protein CMETHOX_21680 [Lacrimispora indolis]|nr:hypothetical protein CMETHOX_21680 [[Clostridium] methoxybenzovorans]